jgi:putative intracellular protease/amidase
MDPERRAAAARTAKIIAAIVAIALLLAAVGLGIAQLAGGDDRQSAPWDGPDAPVVHPAPISGQ